MRSYRKRLIAATTMVGLLAMSGYGLAQEVRGPATGETVRQTMSAKISPKVMPKNRLTPGTLTVRITTGTEAGAPRPPVMRTNTTYIDRGLVIHTKGLPRCPTQRLEATDEEAARQACTGAIVGIGRANATVAFPDQAPIPAPAGVTLFNGPPAGKRPVLIIHAYTTVPVPTTFIVPGVYKRIRKGPLGWRLDFQVPQIAGGSGSLKTFVSRVGKRYRHRGKVRSYGYGRCVNNNRAFLMMEFTYHTVTEDNRIADLLRDRKVAVQRCRG